MQKNALKNILAIVAILGIIIGVGSTMWVSSKELDKAVPTALKVLDSERILLATVQDLLMINYQGELIRKVALSELGIENRIVDIDQTDKGDLLLSITDDALILRCDGKLSTCSPLVQLNNTSFDLQAGQLQIASNPHRGVFYVANSWQQQVEKYDFNGKFLGNLPLDAKGLQYPNDLWVLDDGRIAVTDTNHKRIIILEDNEAQNHKNIFSSFNVSGFPLSILLSQNKYWWVIEGSTGFMSSWLNQYDIQGNKLKTIKLDKGDDPISLSIDDTNTILAVTQQTSSIRMIDKTGFYTGSLEEKGLLDYLNEVRLESKKLEMVQYISWSLLGFSSLLVLFVIGLEYRGTHKPSNIKNEHLHQTSDKNAPVEEDFTWLTHSNLPKVKLTLLGLLFSTPLFMMFLENAPSDILISFSILFLLLFILIFWATKGIYNIGLKGRIGIAQDWIFLDDGFGGRASALASNVYYSPHVLVVDQVAVFYENPLGQFKHYPKSEVAKLTHLLNPDLSTTAAGMAKLLRKIKHPMIGFTTKVLISMLILFMMTLAIVKYMAT